MLSSIIVSAVAIGLPVAGGHRLAPKRDSGPFKWRFRPLCARPYELMAGLRAEGRVS